MRKIRASALMAATLFLGILPGIAQGDNALTQEQLLKATQLSLQDYATLQPEMTRSVSGFKASTAGSTAQVLIFMNADGMQMTARYLCVVQNGGMTCRFQQ